MVKIQRGGFFQTPLFIFQLNQIPDSTSKRVILDQSGICVLVREMVESFDYFHDHFIRLLSNSIALIVTAEEEINYTKKKEHHAR